MVLTRDRLAENLADVRRRIAGAARAAGREPDSVRLVAVTKQVEPDVAAQLVELGTRELGESRPQELWRKHAEVRGDVRWHLVGPLQRNKARRTLPLVSLIHSVDGVALLERLDELAAELDLRRDVLLEVNVSGDAAKHGFRPDELPQVLELTGRLRRVRIAGLMTMAPYDPEPERARPTFAGLRLLRDRLEGATPANCSLGELSMGMSGDFEVAIQEGATIVRIGSALFRAELSDD